MTDQEKRSKNPIAQYDQVGGNHYKNMTIEPIEVAEDWMSPEELIGAFKFNALKYLAPRKKSDDPFEDLFKARDYLNRACDYIEHKLRR